jgi:hypothetical protein
LTCSGSVLNKYYYKHTLRMLEAFQRLNEKAPIRKYYPLPSFQLNRSLAGFKKMVAPGSTPATLLKEDPYAFMTYTSIVFHDIAKPVLCHITQKGPSFSTKGCTHENLSALYFLLTTSPRDHVPEIIQAMTHAILNTHEVRQKNSKVFCKSNQPILPSNEAIKWISKLLKSSGFQSRHIIGAIKRASDKTTWRDYNKELRQKIHPDYAGISQDNLAVHLQATPLSAYVVFLDNAEAFYSRNDKEQVENYLFRSNTTRTRTVLNVMMRNPLGRLVLEIVGGLEQNGYEH